MLYWALLQFVNINNTLMTDSNDLPEDEKKLFHDAMQNVKPLHKKTKLISSHVNKPIKICKPKVKQVHQKQTLVTYSVNKHLQVGSEEILSFKRFGINQKQLSDLKNAKNRYTAKIDLHGMSPDQAASKLSNFVHHSCAQNIKIVLVIHGKGGHDNKPPIIKNMVYSYLQNLPQVLALHSAKPQDGGCGAIYVLLRSRKLK